MITPLKNSIIPGIRLRPGSADVHSQIHLGMGHTAQGESRLEPYVRSAIILHQ